MLEPVGGQIHVTIRTTSGRSRRKGIVLHRCPSLPVVATTHEKEIPVTSPARTIQDLGRVVSPGLRRKAIRQAEYLKLDLGGLPSDRTRSELERAFLRLSRRHGIPQPEVNSRIGPYTVDFLWRDQRLVVETDSYASHAGRQAFEDDHNRELYLSGLGFTVRRFTDTQVYGRAEAVATAVLHELAS
jgi:very-short-patch-repair endonuclease